jgi:hypothetical protein
VVADVARDVVVAVVAGRTMPRQPEDWQKRPPCDTSNRDEVAVGGACYVEVTRTPPCKPAQFEHDGHCFEAVARAKRPSTSDTDTGDKPLMPAAPGH